MTLLPLDTFRERIAYSPYHFHQMVHEQYAPLTSQCNTLVPEYAWQSADMASRSDIRTAIVDAERALCAELGYSVGPEYVTAEQHTWTGGPIVLNRSKVRALGSRTETLIAAGAAVTLHDLDGDGLAETFRVSAATTVTDASSIIVKHGADEIRPVTATIADGVVTIEGPIWLIVKPQLYRRPATVALDPTNSDTFLATLDICSVTTDSSATATFYRNGQIVPTQPSLTWQIKDAEKSIIAAWRNCIDTFAWCEGYPTHVQINYLAGDDLINWEMAISAFAVANMSRRLCDDANKDIGRWQRDMTSNFDNVQMLQMRTEDMSNVFGTRLGHLHAWKQVAGQRRQVGLLI